MRRRSCPSFPVAVPVLLDTACNQGERSGRRSSIGGRSASSGPRPLSGEQLDQLRGVFEQKALGTRSTRSTREPATGQVVSSSMVVGFPHVELQGDLQARQDKQLAPSEILRLAWVDRDKRPLARSWINSVRYWTGLARNHRFTATAMRRREALEAQMHSRADHLWRLRARPWNISGVWWASGSRSLLPPPPTKQRALNCSTTCNSADRSWRT